MENKQQINIDPVKLVSDMTLNVGENLTFLKKSILDGNLKPDQLVNGICEFQIYLSDNLVLIRRAMMSMMQEQAQAQAQQATQVQAHTIGPNALIEYTTEKQIK